MLIVETWQLGFTTSSKVSLAWTLLYASLLAFTSKEYVAGLTSVKSGSVSVYGPVAGLPNKMLSVFGKWGCDFFFISHVIVGSGTGLDGVIINEGKITV